MDNRQRFVVFMMLAQGESRFSMGNKGNGHGRNISIASDGRWYHAKEKSWCLSRGERKGRKGQTLRYHRLGR